VLFLFVVLGGKMDRLAGNGREEVTHVYAQYSMNYGKTLYIKVEGPSHDEPSYAGTIDLLAPNYASAVPLPSATIKENFEVEIKFATRLKPKRVELVNAGIGRLDYYNYFVKLGIPDIAHIRYGIYIPWRNIMLDNDYTEFFVPNLAPVSSLV